MVTSVTFVSGYIFPHVSVSMINPKVMGEFS